MARSFETSGMWMRNKKKVLSHPLLFSQFFLRDSFYYITFYLTDFQGKDNKESLLFSLVNFKSSKENLLFFNQKNESRDETLL